MINAATSTHTNAAADVDSEQLTLLPTSATDRTVTARFRLSKDTRERGLRHVAEIRQMLAERGESRTRTSALHRRAA